MSESTVAPPDQLETSDIFGEIAVDKEIETDSVSAKSFLSRSAPFGTYEKQSDYEDSSPSNLREPANVVRSLPRRLPIEIRPVHEELLQEWEGHVTDLGDNTFWAALVDLTEQDHPDEVVEIEYGEVANLHHISEINVGDVFRWVIGYEREVGRPVRRFSAIVFRQFPGWSKKDVTQSEAFAADFAAQFDQANNLDGFESTSA